MAEAVADSDNGHLSLKPMPCGQPHSTWGGGRQYATHMGTLLHHWITSQQLVRHRNSRMMSLLQTLQDHLWVGCDTCNRWFHVDCVGETEDSMDALGDRKYECKACAGKRCVNRLELQVNQTNFSL